MFQLILISMAAVMSIVFSTMTHPLAMGMVLLIQTSLICFISSQMFYSFWFSYILFLIFLGGMLVLFIYIVSLASNEMFTISLKMLSYSLILLLITLVISMFWTDLFTFTEWNSDMSKMYTLNLMKTESSLFLYSLYNFPSSMMTVLLMNYLLVTLVASVKITNLFYGPLRNMY